MGKNESNTLVRGALLLTLAGVVSKLLSAGYRIPLQNLTGDVGFYVYQQVYPILGIALVLSLYGFPSAISKLTAEIKAEGKTLSLSHFYTPVFGMLCIISGSIFVILFINAQRIALWAGDVQLTKTYVIASFVFLLIPLTALLRGIFQGLYKMKPTAFSQIGEHLGRVGLIIFAAVTIYLQKGNIYQIGEAAALASFFGSSIALLILLLFFKRYRPISRQPNSLTWVYYGKTLLFFGFVAALNHMILLLIQFADTFTLIPALTDYGMIKSEAMELKGIFDRGQPLIQLGSVLGSSFALALIPTLSEEKLRKAPKVFYNAIQNAIAVSFYLAIGATTGLIVLFPEVNRLLYLDASGTAALQVLSLSIFLSALSITAASILQGLGYMKHTALLILIAFLCKWLGNYMFVTELGIMGAALATVFSLGVLTASMYITLKRKSPKLKFAAHVNWKALVIALAGMIGFIYLMEFLIGNITSRFGLLVYIVALTITGAIIYLILLLRKEAFTTETVEMLPFSRLLIRIHKAREPYGNEN